MADDSDDARLSKRRKVLDRVLLSSNTEERVEGCEVVRLEEESAEMFHMFKGLLDKK